MMTLNTKDNTAVSVLIALSLIEKFEGFRSKPYQDFTGRWTIGFGTTEGVGPDSEPITVQQARQLALNYLLKTRKRLKKWEEAQNATLLPHEAGALLSWIYNFGYARFLSSTLSKVIRSGMSYDKIEYQWKRWVYAQNKDTGEMEQVTGLVRRRAAEWEVFAGKDKTREPNLNKLDSSQAPQTPEEPTGYSPDALTTQKGDYEDFVERLSPKDWEEILRRMQSPSMVGMLHGLIGMMSELGEFADAFKKHLIYGKPLDQENLIEELGDIGWYKQRAQNSMYQRFGTPRNEAYYRRSNQLKLQMRYPEQAFNESDALKRADKNEGTQLPLSNN